MKKKGSITVFLSLILVLLFSFLMTMLEAARVCGASAYAAMVSELAGDSLLASYYYPLFQEYRLFGIGAGSEHGFLSVNDLENTAMGHMEYGLLGLQGGMLKFETTEAMVTDYKTLMTEEGAPFLQQVREQLLLDGLSLTATKFFSEEQFTEAGVVGELYQQQETALTELGAVTTELLKLMELVDGICTTDQGLQVDRSGKLKRTDTFLKQLLPMNEQVIRKRFANEEIYGTVEGRFLRADLLAEDILELIQKAEQAEADKEALEANLQQYQEDSYALKTEWKKLKEEGGTNQERIAQIEQILNDWETEMWQIVEEQDDYDDIWDCAMKDAKAKYTTLKKAITGMVPVTQKSLEVVTALEKKQKKAQETVFSYESYLEGMKSLVSEELYTVFDDELEIMKCYAGMEEQGYYVPVMKRSMERNLSLLNGLSWGGFSEKELGRIKTEMEAVLYGMASYTAEGLWFNYGEFAVAKQTGTNILGAVEELLATGVLELVGVSEEMQSDRILDGTMLPSAALSADGFLTNLRACISEIQQMFSKGGIGTVLKAAGNTALDATALEVYCTKYFHTFTEPSEVTKLKYEREYLLFGAREDKTNLFYVVLYLVAVRTLFDMVAILKDSQKMGEIEALATAIAGLTGIPVLLTIIKYAILFLWSVEEAFVDVAALLQGKALSVMGSGAISIDDLLLFNKDMVAGKASSAPEGAGPEYEDYLVLLSLTRSTKKKLYRAMDLIQENIRYRYRDTFRIRNVITELEMFTSSNLKRLYKTGLVPEQVYQIKWKGTYGY